MKRYWIIAMVAATALVLAACSEKSGSDPRWADNYLPAAIDSLSLERTDEITRYVGDSLYEYINGGAELYHLYKFEEVATAGYQQGEAEFVADVYRFADADNAFGLYAAMRPPDGNFVSLGVEGFTTQNGTEFVKDRYLVRIVGFSRSDETTPVIGEFAKAIEQQIQGSRELPATFALFPHDNAVPNSEEITAAYFLGHMFLSEVYTCRISVGDDTLMFFVTDDAPGEKYQQWSTVHPPDETTAKLTWDLAFDDGLVVGFEDDFNGQIVAGLKQGKLVGVVGFKETARDFLAGWLNSLP